MSGGRIRLSTGTLYGALRRMLEDEWIQRHKEENPARGRQGYRLTAKGRRLLEQEVARMNEFTRIASLRLAQRES